jgi:RNA polymerase sigma factor (sigma-70 family)
MKADDKTVGAGASYRAAPGVGVWLRHRLPDWPRIWGACVRRARSWPVPPRWTPRDWREELDAEGIAAACTAIRNFDPARGPTLGSFIYHQILSDALARHRQEWGSGPRRHPGIESRQAQSSHVEQPSATDDVSEPLRRTLGRLVEDDRRLIECLFGEGWPEGFIPAPIGISQRAVNKRKRRILEELQGRHGRIIEL